MWLCFFSLGRTHFYSQKPRRQGRRGGGEGQLGVERVYLSD